MTEVVAATCASCRAPLAGRFCAECGEQRITAHDYSIGHFFEHVLETLTHFDYRSLRAVRFLLSRPGFLTREYLDGRRKRYVGPIQLFVILNLLFALLGGQTFRVALNTKDSGWLARPMQAAASKAQARVHLNGEEFEQEFARSAAIQSKSWIFLMIPLFAAELALLYGFRRYFFEHLVFSTHIHAFLLAWLVVGFVALSVPFRLAGVARPTSNMVITALVLAGLVAYLYAALRRSYGDGRLAALARSFALAVLWVPTLNVYRAALFFITLRLMH